MNTAAPALVVTASALLLLAARRTALASVEAGDDDLIGSFSLEGVAGDAESIWNQLIEQGADVDSYTAAANIAAFLTVIRKAEGTEGRGGYRACYGYSHTISDMSEHPAISGEWRGVVLPAAMCANAGFGPGCKSTAAGAYQIIRPTWIRLRDRLGLVDFTEASQDAAAIELIRQRGALEDVKSGRFNDAVHKSRQEWASLPGNSARQGQRSIDTLAGWFAGAGGAFA